MIKAKEKELAHHLDNSIRKYFWSKYKLIYFTKVKLIRLRIRIYEVGREAFRHC